MPTRLLHRYAALAWFGLTVAPLLPAANVALKDLDLANLHVVGWTPPRVDLGFTGQPLTIAGQKFAHGIGTRATSTLWLELDGRAERLRASVGVDDAAARTGSIRVLIVGDGRKLWDSGVMKRGTPAQPIDVDLTGVHSLLLATNRGAPSAAQDLADWVDASVSYSGAAPRTVIAPRDGEEILTPKPPRAPRINGPRVYGCRPGHPFLFRTPATGVRPLQFSAEGLPDSLHLDASSGIVTGTAPAAGEYHVTLRAKNAEGAAERAFKIVSGDTLALTPTMGWNHWYAHYTRITDAMVRQATDAMVNSGMADVGYSYVCIDDCWDNTTDSDGRRKVDPMRVGPFRDAAGNLNPNRHFPDMAALTRYIHEHGLKAGIYSSPGPLTCGSYAGSYLHEEQDARQFAAWGFDLLKYDWCSYRQIFQKTDQTLASRKEPYALMGGLLKRSPRDIVFNLCQYGAGDVWEWGAEVGGQSWRTAGDLGGELNELFQVAVKNAEHRAWNKPGAWNDPDYLQIGYIGLTRSPGELRPCPLTPTEQYSFMSLWSLMSAPLIFSGDLTRIDAFTLNVLCNPEVIDIDQDPLGECARVVSLTPETFLMVKRLDDGGTAVGLCNADDVSREVTASWSTLGLSPAQQMRDVWRQRDLGASPTYRALVPRHGVVLLRLRPASASASANP